MSIHGNFKVTMNMFTTLCLSSNLCINITGYYAALYYDPESTLDGISKGAFRLLNPFVAPDRLLTDEYEVYIYMFVRYILGILTAYLNYSF
jgi:hypothetical protein